MIKEAYERYKWLTQQLETDAEYLELMEQLRQHEPAFHAALEVLTEEHRTAIITHLGLCSELAERTTEIACFGP